MRLFPFLLLLTACGQFGEEDTTSDTGTAADTETTTGDSDTPTDTDTDTDTDPLAWPVEPDPVLEQRLNDTFGPRILSSADRYDFHSALDIKRDLGTPVLAVADGIVRFAGERDGYVDLSVQLYHELDGETWVSHYTHLSEVEALLEGEPVRQGQVIAAVGQGSSSYPHLHFEMRRSTNENSLRRNAVHPLAWLPYPDHGPPTLTIDGLTRTPGLLRVDTTASVHPEELDLHGLSVVVTRQDTGEVLAEKAWDVDSWNLAHDEEADLDQQEADGLVFDPEEFNDDGSYDAWVLHVGFVELAVPDDVALDVVVTATDVRGQAASVAEVSVND